jgi:hypothetical protein
MPTKGGSLDFFMDSFDEDSDDRNVSSTPTPVVAHETPVSPCDAFLDDSTETRLNI